MTDKSESRFQEAEASLAEFFARIEQGERIDFDAWCADRTHIASELEALHDACDEIHSALETPRLPERLAGADFLAELLSGLARRSGNFDDYRVGPRLAQGGMGEIHSVRDTILHRELAMKRLRGGDVGSSSEIDPRRLARFIEEAQVTAQLDHPGIVPVHELGLDADGRVFFTMKLVQGRDLKQIFQLVSAGAEGWNETRALGVLLKACEAMAYAHKKGVIHRDLKPANVMVGEFGEVYVMDWGLARVIGHEVRNDGRAELPRTSVLRTERSSDRESTPESPLHTMDGDVVGTAAYMPPEQAQGKLEELGPHSDVYSIGAMLYQLLSRAMPYESSSSQSTGQTILERLLAAAPEPLHKSRRDVPGELIAICEKAMAREPQRRYRDTLELAEDLRAYLEHRVVRAHRTGALVELGKWIERNKALAAASLALFLAVVAGLIVSSSLYVKAEKKAGDVLRLSAQHDLESLIGEADRLWPAHPDRIERYVDWLGRAQDLADDLPVYQAKLNELRERAISTKAVDAPPAPAELGAGALQLPTWEFANSEDRWWHDRLAELVGALAEFADAERGLISAGQTPAHGWGVRKRLEFARTIQERSVNGSQAAERWTEAVSSIRNLNECPMYAGLVISPQLGLLPIGRDPDSGLWEFAHLQSGAQATRGSEKKLILGAETGLVLVLVPSGTFWMGAQSVDPNGRNYDPIAWRQKTKVHMIPLSPYFLSKYEMTQGQWKRTAGNDPSYLHAEKTSSDPSGELHPLESASWLECEAWTSRLGLSLPTEAQWEYAARAGSSTVWSSGNEQESLIGAANLLDRYAEDHEGFGWSAGSERWLDDGRSWHAEVGTYRPNAFGLHDVHGNVSEWCRDLMGSYELPVDAASGERFVGKGQSPPQRICRGGSFRHAAWTARSACRGYAKPDFRDFCLGLRPARILSPP